MEHISSYKKGVLSRADLRGLCWSASVMPGSGTLYTALSLASLAPPIDYTSVGGSERGATLSPMKKNHHTPYNPTQKSPMPILIQWPHIWKLTYPIHPKPSVLGLQHLHGILTFTRHFILCPLEDSCPPGGQTFWPSWWRGRGWSIHLWGVWSYATADCRWLYNHDLRVGQGGSQWWIRASARITKFAYLLAISPDADSIGEGAASAEWEVLCSMDARQHQATNGASMELLCVTW